MLWAAFLAALVLLMATTFAVPVEAAAPRLIMVSGLGICQPVILDDWSDNLDLMESIDTAEVVDVTGRSYLELGLFWGPEWDNYVREGKPLDDLRMEQAEQHAKLYPAVDDAAPAMVIDGATAELASPRELKPEGVEILARHGVPTHLESESAAVADCPSSLPWGWIAGGAAAGAALLLGGATVALRKRHALR